MITSTLAEFWQKKELEAGRIITVQEVSRKTNLNWETIRRLKENKTRRFDSHVIAELCQFFDVPDGEQIPFLSVIYEEKEKPPK